MIRTESAVSPVVGVMLMLAITVMIAAIVSAAAGGLSESEKQAPGALLDVSIYAAKHYPGENGDYSIPSMTIKHISGNILQTKDRRSLRIIASPPQEHLLKGA